MATDAVNVALHNAANRRRTPRIKKVLQEATANLTIIFDRPMDVLAEDFVIRTFDPATGIVDWTPQVTTGWVDERTLNTDQSNVVDPSCTGPQYAIYLRGNLRAKGRFRVDNYERCDAVENA